MKCINFCNFIRLDLDLIRNKKFDVKNINDIKVSHLIILN